MSGSAIQDTRRWWTVEDLLVVLLLGVLFYLPGLGDVCLFDRDEPRFATAAREMLQSGDYAVPRFNGQLRPDKPPLIYWLMAAAYRIFGVNEFAARLPSAVAGTLTLVVVYLAAGRRFGRETGVVAALLLGSATLFVAESRLATADAVMVFFTTVALALAWEAWDARRGRRGWGGFWVAVGFWTALALGVLTKGVPLLFVLLPLLVLPLATGRAGEQWRAWWGLAWGQRLMHLPEVLARVVARGNWGFWRGLRPAWGWMILVAMVGAWVGAVWASPEGPDLLAMMLGRHVKDRALRPAEGHWGPPGFYLGAVWGTFWPWSVLLLPMTFHVWRRLRGRAILETDPRPYQFLTAWMVPAWLVYEGIATKMVHYVLPLAIPLAILCADTLVQAWGRRTEVLAAGWFAWARWVWAGIWGVLAGAVVTATYLFLDRELIGPAWLLAGALAATGVTGALAWGHRGWPRVTVLGFGAALVVANVMVLPQIQELRLSAAAAGVANALQEEGYAVGAAGYEEGSLVFYSGRMLPMQGRTLYLKEDGLSADERARLRAYKEAVRQAFANVWAPGPKRTLREGGGGGMFGDPDVATVLIISGEEKARLEAAGIRPYVVRRFTGWQTAKVRQREVYVVANRRPVVGGTASGPATTGSGTRARELFEGGRGDR